MSSIFIRVKQRFVGTQHNDSDSPLEEGRDRPFALSRSPFERLNSTIHNDQDRQRLLSHELLIKVAEEVPWSDLLLEIAMTTTFASLTDGTQISSLASVASYVSFFALVWWIWASQVAYNMRFRQTDILHRVYVVLQLFVFAALAAFTDNFDITQLTPPSSTSMQSLVQTKQESLAAQHRSVGIATAHTRGISLVMALSRLLLLVQYSVVFYYARTLKRRAIGVHVVTLFFSMICYLVAYLILQGNVAEGKEIAKLVLWFLPVVLEVASHYVANMMPGHVAYPAEIVSKRSATVFIIVLGGGLDKITQGFQFFVGNGDFGFTFWRLLFCAALIFICQFALYFNSRPESGLSSIRSLSWLFSHFFFLAALIVTLQGIATQLTSGRLGEGFTHLSSALSPIQQFIVNNPGINVSCCNQWPDAQQLYTTNGWALSDDINFLNSYIVDAVEFDLNASLTGVNAWDQMYVNDLWGQMDLFDVEPSDDLLDSIEWFVEVADAFNSTQVNPSELAYVLDQIWKDQAIPSSWFFTASGLTLLMLTATSLIAQWHKVDKWFILLLGSRITAGTTLLLLTTLDVGYATPEFNADDQLTPDRFWTLVDKYLILLIVAVILLFEQIVEMVLIFLANVAVSSSVPKHTMQHSSGQGITYNPLRDELDDNVASSGEILPTRSKGSED